MRTKKRTWTAKRIDSRTCFAIAYFATEEEAISFGKHVAAKGETYWGGFYHGMPCGRAKSWDVTSQDGTTLYAATFQSGNGLTKTY